MLPSWLIVLLLSLLTAVATGLGAIPLAIFKSRSKRVAGVGNAIAAGFMLGASILLIHQGLDEGPRRLALGVFLGLALVWVAQRLVPENAPNVADLQGGNARSAFLVLLIMTVHSFAEGIGVGVSFGTSDAFGVLISLAIAIQNIPEGLAISLSLVPRGASVFKASLWSVFTSLPQPIMALPAFLFVLAFKPFLPVGLGLAGGAMVWMVFSEILPEAFEHSSSELVATVATLSVFAMILLGFVF